MGTVNAIAAAGRLAKAKAPPPSMPAQRHAMIIWPPADAFAKNNNGSVAHMLPSSRALRAARTIARRETYDGLFTFTPRFLIP